MRLLGYRLMSLWGYEIIGDYAIKTELLRYKVQNQEILTVN